MSRGPAEAVRGTGTLATVLGRLLARRAPATSATVLVSTLGELRDRWPVTDLEHGAALVLVGVGRATVYVGPRWREGQRGCPACLLMRAWSPAMSSDDEDATSGSATACSLGPHVAPIVVELIEALPDAGAEAPGAAVFLYNTHTGVVRRHVLIPDSSCPTCGTPPHATLPCFTEPSQPRLKLDATTLRTRAIDHQALAPYVSPLGLFRSPSIDLQSPFGSCSVELPAIAGRATQPAMGRGQSFREGRSIAVLEGLERYCGFHRGGGRRARIRAPYQDVADRAVFPPSLGTHPAESYVTERFGHRPFAPDTVVDWVEAHSMARQGPVLVPERVAFWGPRTDGEVSFFSTTSNGCAIGSSIEEATLHGLLEVVERDSFLLTWYRQLRLPELDLTAHSDPGLRMLLRRCELYTGCRFRAFWSTMEHGIPSLWLTAEGTDPHGPAFFAGAAADLWVRPALRKGIKELAKLVLAVKHHYPTWRAAGLRMLDDPNEVRNLEHHPLVNCLPEARDRFSFLVHTDAAPLPVEAFESVGLPDNLDLRADLFAMVERLLACGMDVLVVDQTMPELEPAGLFCVKVIVPGMLPITFGHAHRRTENLPRLIAPGLPYRDVRAPGAAPVLHPHPFH